MYALIYDEHDFTEQKKVISVHRTRENAEKALEKRKKELGKKVWECNTRVVWLDKSVSSGDYVREGEFSTWRPGEPVPEGEVFPDSD